MADSAKNALESAFNKTKEALSSAAESTKEFATTALENVQKIIPGHNGQPAAGASSTDAPVAPGETPQPPAN